MDKYQTLREKDHPENNVYPNIQTQNIPDGGVPTAKIADGSVTTDKLANTAVTADKIANNAVTQGKIASGSVTSLKIGSEAVTTAKIASSAVTSAKIASGAVSETKISDGNVSAIKFKNEWHPLGWWFSQYNVTDLASLRAFLTLVFDSKAFYRAVWKSGVGIYPIDWYIDYDNGEVRYLILGSTGYTSLAYITTDAEFTTFANDHSNDIFVLGFIN